MGSGKHTSAFVRIKVNDISCYALVDSGASISLCSREILGPYDYVKLDLFTRNRVRGVSGNYLYVLGSLEITCSLGGFVFQTNVTVVDEMVDCVFIIGRDVLQPHECIINYQDLTFQIVN